MEEEWFERVCNILMKDPFSMCMDEIAELTDWQIANVCLRPDPNAETPPGPNDKPAEDFMTAMKRACEEAGTPMPQVE